MYRRVGKVAQMVQQPVPHVVCNVVPFHNRKRRVYGYIQLRVQPVPQPSDSHFADVFHALYVSGRVIDLINDFRVYPVEQAGEDRLPESQTMRSIAIEIMRPTAGSADG